MAFKEGYINGLRFTRAWGQEHILANDPDDMGITPKGIQYLSDNDKMKRIAETLLRGAGAIAELVKVVFAV